MICLNTFCIYQQNEKCTLKTISIDENARCVNMTMPDIDSEKLKRMKINTKMMLESDFER